MTAVWGASIATIVFAGLLDVVASRYPLIWLEASCLLSRLFQERYRYRKAQADKNIFEQVTDGLNRQAAKSGVPGQVNLNNRELGGTR